MRSGSKGSAKAFFRRSGRSERNARVLRCTQCTLDLSIASLGRWGGTPVKSVQSLRRKDFRSGLRLASWRLVGFRGGCLSSAVPRLELEVEGDFSAKLMTTFYRHGL